MESSLQSCEAELTDLPNVETVSRLLWVIIAHSSDSIPAHVLVRVLDLPVRILHTSSLATYIVVVI